jgi:hypothetical protein
MRERAGKEICSGARQRCKRKSRGVKTLEKAATGAQASFRASRAKLLGRRRKMPPTSSAKDGRDGRDNAAHETLGRWRSKGYNHLIFYTTKSLQEAIYCKRAVRYPDASMGARCWSNDDKHRHLSI